jgi:hypothetical protein
MKCYIDNSVCLRSCIRNINNIPKCDRIFDYLLQEKQIKLPSSHVIPSSKQLKNMLIVNGIILTLMLLMIAMFSVNRFNHP